MRSLFSKILFYYSAIATFLITASLVLTAGKIAPVIFATLFLPVAAYFIIEFFKQIRSLTSKGRIEGSDLSTGPKKGEVIVISLIFLALTGFALKNILMAKSKPQETTTPQPSFTPVIFKTSTPPPENKITIIKTSGSGYIFIYKEATNSSQKVGVAQNGETYPYYDVSGNWYHIKFASGSGYIEAKYVK